jgi:HAD superfamily phosphoserine phosphatase-like hydrolase
VTDPVATNVVGFDLNKTLIRENSWYDLNIAMGISPGEDEFLYRLGPEGEAILTYEEWINLLVRLMRKRGQATRHNMERVMLAFDYLDGAQEVVAELKKQGCAVGVISGAMSPIVDRVAQDLDLDFALSNAQLSFGQDGTLQDIHLQGADLQFKVEAVRTLQQTYGNGAEIYYVADGDNDEAVFKVTKGILIDVATSSHEDWKQQALEGGAQFSSSAARTVAWKVVPTISDVPGLIAAGRRGAEG